MKRLLPAILLAAALLASGCHSNVPPPGTPPVYTLSTDLGGSDPIEPFNRAMYQTNLALLRWGYRPVGYFWGTIFPGWVIDRFNCFTDNTGFTVRMLSCFLQAKFAGGGVELARFVTNSTLGCAGFFEVADPWFGMKRHDEEFGQAFASWGIGPGCYVFLPVYGPSNVRDAIGAAFDAAADPKSYIYGGQAFTAVNRIAANYGEFDMLYRSQPDGYELLRDLYLQKRNVQIADFYEKPDAFTRCWWFDENGELVSPMLEPVLPENGKAAAADKFSAENIAPLPGFAAGGYARDTLRVLGFRPPADTVWPFLSPWNSNFYRGGTVRSLQLMPDRPALDYKFYPAPGEGSVARNAPLFVMLCGLGGHYSSDLSTALAAIAHENGMAAVVFSNVMHPDFLEAAEPGYCAGYTPLDVELLRGAITAAVEDLRENEDITPSCMVLCGYSHGALHTMFLATEPEKLPLPLKKAVAISPPVDPVTAIGQIDGFADVAESWSKEEAQAKVSRAVSLYLEGGNIGSVDPDTARALIGIAFRFTLRDAIVARHRHAEIPALDQPWDWGDRYQLYIKANQCDFNWYMNNVLLGFYREYYGKPSIDIETLRIGSSLRSIAPELKNSRTIYLIHADDDPLVSKSDAAFLEDVCAGRLTVFRHGGHLGYLYRPEFRELMDKLLSENK
ncbi:MAG: MlaA family lipoprotein [Victivallaceae bacterium]